MSYWCLFFPSIISVFPLLWTAHLFFFSFCFYQKRPIKLMTSAWWKLKTLKWHQISMNLAFTWKPILQILWKFYNFIPYNWEYAISMSSSQKAYLIEQHDLDDLIRDFDLTVGKAKILESKLQKFKKKLSLLAVVWTAYQETKAYLLLRFHGLQKVWTKYCSFQRLCGSKFTQ